MGVAPNNEETKSNELVSLIGPPIVMITIHEHPLLYCCPIDRIKYGKTWSCNKCKKDYDINKSSFYCTFCDFDICSNCIGEYQIEHIVFYNSNESHNLKNIVQKQDIFKWQKQFPGHSHYMTLILKENKSYNWTCDKCKKNYSNNKSSYYCSLCDYDLCENCSGEIINKEIEIIKPKPIILKIENYINEFQIKSFKILNEEYNNKNLIYSPLSIQLLLGLLSNGITGKSLTEFKNVFLFEDINSQNNIFIKLLQSLENIPSINIANAVFSPFPHLPNFQTFISNYKAIFSRNKEELNQFIMQKTNNKINNYFGQSILFGMILTNIFYFKEEWKKKFTEIFFQKTFYINNKKEKLVKMINLPDDFKYYKDQSIEMIEIPFKIEGLFAIIILPCKDLSIDNLINQLDQDKLNKLYDNSSLKKIDLTMPKFNFLEKNKIHLENMLKKIGIISIFDSYSSDLTKIYENSNNIGINEIFQTNLIEIDENGKDDNLFSILKNEPLVNPKNMLINRPFLFIIKNNKSEKGKDIVLMAKIVDI